MSRLGRLLVVAILALVACAAVRGDDSPAETAPADAKQPSPAKSTVAPPRDRKQIDAAIDRGIQFLLEKQNGDGSWGSARDTIGMEDLFSDPVPGAHHAFRAAVTAMCISALIEVGGDSTGVDQAIDRAEAWLIPFLPRVKRHTPEVMYNVWTHAYAIDALVHLLKRHPDDAQRAERLKQVIRDQIAMLERYESVDGGWGYYDFRAGTKVPASDSTSFCTATALVALDEARQIGVEAPERLVKRAIASILRQKRPDFSYLYGEYLKWVPEMGINEHGGSLGRSQACNLALRLWGDKQVTDTVISHWLDLLYARNMWLDLGRKKPIPHESYFQVAAYFYYYGHYYASLVTMQLPPDDRDRHFDQLADLMLTHQEKDGSWWDYPLYNYHQQYGTAFALMTLGRCR